MGIRSGAAFFIHAPAQGNRFSLFLSQYHFSMGNSTGGTVKIEIELTPNC